MDPPRGSRYQPSPNRGNPHGGAHLTPGARLWSRTSKIILGAGGLAVAISSVVSLWPAADPTDRASVDEITVIDGVTLFEYQKRLASAPTVEHKAYSQQLPSSPAGPTGSSRTTRESHVSSSSPSTAGGSSTATSTADPASTSAGNDRQSGTRSTSTPVADNHGAGATAKYKLEDRTGAPSDVVDETARKVLQNIGQAGGADDPTDVSKILPVLLIAIQKCTDTEGRPVEPAEAAEQVAAVLRDARRPPSGSKEKGAPRVNPEGVLTTSHLTLTGLRNRTVALSWSMWSRGPHQQLHADWLNENSAYELTPTTNEDTTAVDLWIPLPKDTGEYFVRITLRVDGTVIATADSEVFS